MPTGHPPPQVTVDGCSGPVNTFIVEPFVPHDAEYYLSVQSKRLGDDISFSEAGGVEIEANWDRVQTVGAHIGRPFVQLGAMLALLQFPNADHVATCGDHTVARQGSRRVELELKEPKRARLYARVQRPMTIISSSMLISQVTIPTLGDASAEALAPLLGGLPLELRPKMETFIQGVYAVSAHIILYYDAKLS